MKSSKEHHECKFENGTSVCNTEAEPEGFGERSEKKEKSMIIKNVYVMGIVFCLLFLPFMSLCDLQSSLFINEGLGVICQAIIYVSFIFSSCFLPTFAINTLGHKWTLVVAQYGYVIWMSANGYASWVTMTIASVIVGVSAGPLWTIFGAYINVLATRYAAISGTPRQAILPRFFGIAVAFFKSSRLFGSLISWAAFQAELKNSTVVDPEHLQYCGASDCPWLNVTNDYYNMPPMRKLWIAVGCHVAIGVLSIIVAVLFLDSLPRDWYMTEEMINEPTRKKTRVSIVAAGRLHGNVKQLLLLPIFLHQGIMLSFVQADFTKSFVTCPFGIWMVGLILLPNSAVGILAALLSGRIAKTYSTFPWFCIAFFIDTGILLLCLFWKPNPSHVAVLFVMSTLTGISEAVWFTQINSLVGIIFPTSSAAYANSRLWCSVGNVLIFATSNAMCVRTRIYMMLAVLALNILCLIIIHKPCSDCLKDGVGYAKCDASAQPEASALSTN